ncbi:hypothetical protein AAC387_Pa07g2275 [Persea americana]
MDYYSDHSWMRRRKSSAQIGATTEFRTGCQVFLDYAYSHPECVNGQNKIRCPCLKCKNVNYMDRAMVAYHLLVKGFMNNYEDCWWAHGQRRDSGITQVHNPGSSTHRMNDMVHDIAGPDFDWEQDREQVMNSDAKAFFKLLDEGSEPLWPGCTKQTTLSAVTTLLNIKADHNTSHECFESLLKAIKSTLPDGEKLTDNYYFYYFPDEELTKANRVPRHDDGGNVELNGRLSVFGLPGRAYGKGKRILLSEQELHAAHTYILFNCEEIDDFVRSYDDELKANQSGITDKDIQLSRDQNFALWLKDKALNDVSIPSNVQVLAMGSDRDQVCRNEDDGYESPHDVQDDSESDNDFH